MQRMETKRRTVPTRMAAVKGDEGGDDRQTVVVPAYSRLVSGGEDASVRRGGLSTLAEGAAAVVRSSPSTANAVVSRANYAPVGTARGGVSTRITHTTQTEALSAIVNGGELCSSYWCGRVVRLWCSYAARSGRCRCCRLASRHVRSPTRSLSSLSVTAERVAAETCACTLRGLLAFRRIRRGVKHWARGASGRVIVRVTEGCVQSFARCIRGVSVNRGVVRVSLAVARVLVNRGDAGAKLASKKEGWSTGLGADKSTGVSVAW